MRGSDRLTNRKADAYSRILGNEQAAKELNHTAHHAGSVEPNVVDTAIQFGKIARGLEAQYAVSPGCPS